MLADIKRSILDVYPNAPLAISGHTDDIGSQAYNLSLSTRRAESVGAWLRGHGIAAGRVHVKGCGKSMPRHPNNSEENRARNRRVEILVRHAARQSGPGATSPGT